MGTADPARSAPVLRPAIDERLRELHPDLDHRLQQSPDLGPALKAVTGASAFLARLLVTDPRAIETISHLDHKARAPELAHPEDGRHSGTLQAVDAADALVAWKQHELLRIATRDLLGVDELEAVGANLAALAEDVLRSASAMAGADERIVVIGMGKLGGNELNYASDVDVMFTTGAGDDPVVDEQRARRILEIARRCFRVDANLRPEGRDGPLVRSLDSFRSYWEQWASPWEFQALLKARTISGPSDLQAQWTTTAEHALWTHAFGVDELRQLRDMKATSERLIEERGLTGREVKRGRGGIRDVEFAVQLLQLVHGGLDPTIRSATTLIALDQLALGGYIDRRDADALTVGYRYLRTVEHRLQLEEEEQTHTVPASRPDRDRVARTMGYTDTTERSAVEAFDKELRQHQVTVRQTHERLYFRPLLESFATGGSLEGPMAAQLSAFGFTDVERTRQAVVELTRGLARSSRLMQQLMPLLLDWLSTSPDPDEGLLGLRTLIAGFRTPAHLVGIFRDAPEAARRLCCLLGTSRLFSQGITRHPELLDDLVDGVDLAELPAAIDRLRRALKWRPSADARHAALRRYKRAEQLRIAAADVLGTTPSTDTGRQRSALAAAVLQLTLEDLAPSVPLAIIGLGRFGGEEMSYASDLDVMVVHDGADAAGQAEAERVAQALLHYVGDPSPERQVYPLDYDLRPEGRNGALARSIAGCVDYYGNWAATWERQALVRARFVAGDAAVGQRFLDAVEGFVWGRPMTSAEIRDVRQLKARMERERIPRGEDPEFHLKLGRGALSDIEWTTQLLQLEHRIPGTNTLRALDDLRKAGALDDSEHDVLRDAWEFCDRVRNRWFLVNGGTSDSLPMDPSRLAVLARSLGMAPVELREHYRKLTRRCRKVMELRFYGQTGV